MQGVYQEVNTHLVERRILPEIRPGIRRTNSTPAPQRAKPSPGNTPANAGANANTAAPAQVPRSEGDILGALAELLGGGNLSAGAPPAGMPSGAAAVGGAP